jgi:hypothetical protein
MRTIEFRGLRTDGKGWAYGNLWLSNGRATIDDDVNDYPVTPSTVGQFTGLYDKNGVKVFEGDVVRVHGRGGEFWTGASIAYHSPSFKLQKDLNTCDEFGWDEWERDFEVTGTIHEPATVRK